MTAPLNLVHPEQGIVLAVTLSIPSNLKAELEALDAGAATTANTTGTDTTGTGTTDTGLGVGVATTPTCTPTSVDTTTTTTATSPVITPTSDCTSTTNIQFTVGIDFDAERDLVPFTISGQPGFLLNPHLTALRPVHRRHDSGNAQSLCALKPEYLHLDDRHHRHHRHHHDTQLLDGQRQSGH